MTGRPAAELRKLTAQRREAGNRIRTVRAAVEAQLQELEEEEKSLSRWIRELEEELERSRQILGETTSRAEEIRAEGGRALAALESFLRRTVPAAVHHLRTWLGLQLELTEKAILTTEEELVLDPATGTPSRRLRASNRGTLETRRAYLEQARRHQLPELALQEDPKAIEEACRRIRAEAPGVKMEGFYGDNPSLGDGLEGSADPS